MRLKPWKKPTLARMFRKRPALLSHPVTARDDEGASPHDATATLATICPLTQSAIVCVHRLGRHEFEKDMLVEYFLRTHDPRHPLTRVYVSETELSQLEGAALLKPGTLTWIAHRTPPTYHDETDSVTTYLMQTCRTSIQEDDERLLVGTFTDLCDAYLDHARHFLTLLEDDERKKFHKMTRGTWVSFG